MLNIRFVLLLLCFYAQCRGRVYVDINRNCKYDLGKTLLENVAVTDGTNIVLTNDLGKF